MKVCVFQGTFNPIHNAHLRVANFVAENFDFDKIIFIPAYNPPHKVCSTDLSMHRLNMVRLVVDNAAGFDVSDIEYERKGKSYTYLTICELYKNLDIDGKVNFIIGTDAFSHIESWYEADKLKDLVKFLVFVREDNFDISRYNCIKDKGYDFEFQTLPYRDISSTELRNKIKNGENIDDYVTKEVKDYIYKNELYKD